jgi:NADPH-dependent 7-cyano-7-deazaguanine reductase QueF
MEELMEIILNNFINLLKNENLMATILGAMIGGMLTFVIEIHFRKKDARENEKHFASILYYDLLSIKDYIENERSSVDVRYSQEWQSLIAHCTFLKSEYIGWIYKIYDSIYNYDYSMKSRKENKTFHRKEEIDDYKKLQNYFKENSVNTILNDLRDKIGLKE